MLGGLQWAYWLVALLDVVRVNAEITPFVLQSAFLSFGDASKVPALPPVAPTLWWATLDGEGPLSAWPRAWLGYRTLSSDPPVHKAHH